MQEFIWNTEITKHIWKCIMYVSIYYVQCSTTTHHLHESNFSLLPYTVMEWCIERWGGHKRNTVGCFLTEQQKLKEGKKQDLLIKKNQSLFTSTSVLTSLSCWVAVICVAALNRCNCTYIHQADRKCLIAFSWTHRGWCTHLEDFWCCKSRWIHYKVKVQFVNDGTQQTLKRSRQNKERTTLNGNSGTHHSWETRGVWTVLINAVLTLKWSSCNR